MKIRLGTRGSDLARTQATTIASQLRQRGADVEMHYIRTSGDDSAAPNFASVGPQGMFVRELENALINGNIDVAVHSYKDLPTDSPASLIVAAVPERLDAADVLITREPMTGRNGRNGILSLPEGATVGTASARRQVWIRHFRPDLVATPLRGNLPTRLRRLKAGEYDAILLASSGIARLRSAGDVLDESLAALFLYPLDPEQFVPAPSQGALAIQCRRTDSAVWGFVAELDHPASKAAVAEERAALALAEGGCDTAFGAYCTNYGDGAVLYLMIERAGRIHQSKTTDASVDGLGSRAWSALTTVVRRSG